MYRQITASLSVLSLRAGQLPAQQVRSTSWKSGSDDEHSAHEIKAARKWASDLRNSSIPEAKSTRFDRSSGKGGQHVNTTSSKATCRWEMERLRQFVPKILHQELRNSTYYAPASDSLVIQAQSSRSQQDNERECHQKLYQLFRDAAKHVIPGETSQKQKVKVEQIPSTPRGGWFKWERRNKIHGKQLRKLIREAQLAKQDMKRQKRPFFTPNYGSKHDRNSGNLLEQKADNEARLRMKKQQSARKQSRKGTGVGED